MCLPFPDLDKSREFRGEQYGFQYEGTIGPMGFRCGYVRVLPGHPWFGLQYDDIDANAHGGLTFSAYGKDCDSHDGHGEWWVGFDCGHAGDALDPALRDHPALRDGGMFRANDFLESKGLNPTFTDDRWGATVRTREYVEAECHSLCQQALEAARPFGFVPTAIYDGWKLDFPPEPTGIGGIDAPMLGLRPLMKRLASEHPPRLMLNP